MDFLNKNYKIFLNPKEKILLHTQQAKSYTFLHVLGCFIVALLFSVIFVLWAMEVLKINDNFLKVLPLSIYISLFFAFISYLRYKGIQYLITENGIYKISGLLNKKIKFVPYKKITDNSLSINMFEAIFSVGTINISTAGGTRSYRGNSQPYELRITHINEYNKTNQLITKNI